MLHSLEKTIYLDHAATTPLDPTVYEVMLPHLRDTFGNPSSIHHIGRAAFDTLAKARASLADSLAVKPTELVFTGSGTESDNLAIRGIAHAHREYGNQIIVSAIEHKAVLEAAKQLKVEGFTVTYLPVDEYGRVQLSELERVLTNDTILISAMYANNEIGTIEPVKEISELLVKHYKGKRKPVFHTDACQAVGLLPVSPIQLGVDAMTINSSKIYGPKGIGLLYVKDGIKIESQQVGGHQEGGRRAGTESVALAIGFAQAVELAIANTEAEAGRLAALRDDLLTKLQKQIPSLILNGHANDRLANNIHICIPHIEGESLVLMLDAAGICASTGSACNASDLEPSHVLRAIGRDDDIIHGSLRFSLGKNTTEEELDYTAEKLSEAVARLLAISVSNTIPMKKHAKKDS